MQAKSRETHQTRLPAFMELYESIGRRHLLPELYTIIIAHLKVAFSRNFHFLRNFLNCPVSHSHTCTPVKMMIQSNLFPKNIHEISVNHNRLLLWVGKQSKQPEPSCNHVTVSVELFYPQFFCLCHFLPKRNHYVRQIGWRAAIHKLFIVSTSSE